MLDFPDAAVSRPDCSLQAGGVSQRVAVKRVAYPAFHRRFMPSCPELRHGFQLYSEG